MAASSILRGSPSLPPTITAEVVVEVILPICNWRVRVWLNESPHWRREGFPGFARDQLFDWVTKRCSRAMPTLPGLAEVILYHFDAGAVEIVDKERNGVVLYANWPA